MTTSPRWFSAPSGESRISRIRNPWRFLKPEHVWPINEVWALHAWTYHMNGPALGVRVRLVGEDGHAALPVFYSDNYLVLMPGEERTVTASFDPSRIAGDPVWQLSGWNL